jgi:hypothetical protein
VLLALFPTAPARSDNPFTVKVIAEGVSTLRLVVPLAGKLPTSVPLVQGEGEMVFKHMMIFTGVDAAPAVLFALLVDQESTVFFPD